MSKRIKLCAFFFLAVAFSLLLPQTGTNAWNESGHRIAAYIAWQHLTPQAKSTIADILKKAPADSDLLDFFDAGLQNADEQYFVDIASWADVIKDRNKQERFQAYNRSHWHYVNSYWKQTENGPVVVDGPEVDENIVERIFRFRRTLNIADLPDEDKAVQIAWMIHLIGDIHQPLHNTTRVSDKLPEGDAGGNGFSLGDGWPWNLHSFWDGIIDLQLPRGKNEPKPDYYQQRAQEIMSLYPQEEMKALIKIQNPQLWTQESAQITMDSGYPPSSEEGVKPSAEFRQQAFEIAQKQLALAGYRMAAVLNDIFAQR